MPSSPLVPVGTLAPGTLFRLGYTYLGRLPAEEAQRRSGLYLAVSRYLNIAVAGPDTLMLPADTEVESLRRIEAQHTQPPRSERSAAQVLAYLLPGAATGYPDSYFTLSAIRRQVNLSDREFNRAIVTMLVAGQIAVYYHHSGDSDCSRSALTGQGASRAFELGLSIEPR